MCKAACFLAPAHNYSLSCMDVKHDCSSLTETFEPPDKLHSGGGISGDVCRQPTAWLAIDAYLMHCSDQALASVIGVPDLMYHR